MTRFYCSPAMPVRMRGEGVLPMEGERKGQSIIADTPSRKISMRSFSL